MTSSYRAGVASDFTPPREVRPVVGEVYAARVFVLDSTSCILTGLSYPQAILDGINVALCPNDTHDADAPGDDCRCGFWAYDQPKTWWVDPETESGVVPAVVELTGKAVVGERGIRAQKMRVVAVVLPGDISHADRQVFVANYPQVRLFASVKEMLTEFPLSDLVRPEETPEPKPRREFRPLLKGALRACLAVYLAAFQATTPLLCGFWMVILLGRDGAGIAGWTVVVLAAATNSSERRMRSWVIRALGTAVFVPAVMVTTQNVLGAALGRPEMHMTYTGLAPGSTVLALTIFAVVVGMSALLGLTAMLLQHLRHGPPVIVAAARAGGSVRYARRTGAVAVFGSPGRGKIPVASAVATQFAAQRALGRAALPVSGPSRPFLRAVVEGDGVRPKGVDYATWTPPEITDLDLPDEDTRLLQ